MSFFYKSW